MRLRTEVVLIHSVGLMGASLGWAMKAAGSCRRIIGLSSKENLEAALKLGCIDEGYPYEELSRLVGEGDLLFLCSPVGGIIDAIGRLASLRLSPGMVISDIGSTKRKIVEEARKRLPSHVYFIGGHPMAGSEKSGAVHADLRLFRNAVYALVPASLRPSQVEEEFASFLDETLGCRHLFIDPEVHDRMVAVISHLPHLLAVALLNAAAGADVRMPGTLSLAGGGFRDMTRIGSSPYGMWRDIFATNADAVLEALDEYIEELKKVRSALLTERLKELFDNAARSREKISSNKSHRETKTL